MFPLLFNSLYNITYLHGPSDMVEQDFYVVSIRPLQGLDAEVQTAGFACFAFAAVACLVCLAAFGAMERTEFYREGPGHPQTRDLCMYVTLYIYTYRSPFSSMNGILFCQ